MGAADFQMAVGVEDNASVIFGHIAGSFGKMSQSIAKHSQKVSVVFGSLAQGKELKAVTAGIEGIGKSTGVVASGVSALTGTLNFLQGASTVAGVAETVAEWGKLGVETKNLSDRLGIPTEKLIALKGAATIAGASADGMSSTLQSLSQSLNDAQFNRNLPLLVALKTVHIEIKRTKSGAIDLVTYLKDSAAAIGRQDTPETKVFLASKLGVESLMPVMLKGAAGVDEYIKKQNELRPSIVGLTEAQDALGLKTRELGEAVSSVGDVLASRLIPEISPIIDKTTQWTVSNRGLAATLTEIATGIGTVWTAAKLVNPVIGGIVMAAEAVGWLQDKYHLEAQDTGIDGVGFNDFAVGGGPSSVDNKSSPSPAKVVAGKSSLSTASRDNTGTNPPGGAVLPRGLRQNNPGNIRSWGDRKQKDGYAVFETPEDGLEAAAENLIKQQTLHGKNTVREIVNRWAPASENNTKAYVDDVSARTGLAPDKTLDLSDKNTTLPLLSAIIQHESGQQPFTLDQLTAAFTQALSQSAQSQKSQEVNVNVNVAGGGQGTTATASVSGSGGGDPFMPTAPKIGYSMPNM